MASDPDDFFEGQQYAARTAALDGLDSEKHDPEQAARALQLSQATGADPSLIYDDVPTYEDRLKAHMVDEFLRTNPHLQDYANSHPLAPVVSANDWAQLDAVDEKLLPFLKGGASVVSSMAKAFKENFDLGEAYDRSASDRYAVEGNRLAWSLATAFYEPAQALAIGVPTQAFKAGLAAASAGFEEAQIRAGVSPGAAAYNARQMTSLLEARAMRLEGAPHNVVPILNEKLKKDVQKALPYIDAGREPPYAVSDMAREAAKLQSKEDTKAIADLMGEVKKSETREGAPELFKEGFVRPMTEDARFGIDAEAVLKLYGDKIPEKDDGLLGWVPHIKEQFERAKIGADIDVSVADFTAHMPDEVFKELKDHIRARAGGMTPEEAKAPARPEAKVEEAAPPPVGAPKPIEEGGKQPIEDTTFYHGTRTEFEAFSHEAQKDRPDGAFYFTPREKTAKNYSTIEPGGMPRVIAAKLDIKNPKVMSMDDIGTIFRETAEGLKAEGYDGAVAYNSDGTIYEVAAFDAHQIRQEPTSPPAVRDALGLPPTVVPEAISSAAIRVGDKIYTGIHHGEAALKAEADLGKEIDSSIDSDLSGFMTNKGRYVDREEAQRIAATAEQVKEDAKLLLSEKIRKQYAQTLDTVREASGLVPMAMPTGRARPALPPEGVIPEKTLLGQMINQRGHEAKADVSFPLKDGLAQIKNDRLDDFHATLNEQFANRLAELVGDTKVHLLSDKEFKSLGERLVGPEAKQWSGWFDSVTGDIIAQRSVVEGQFGHDHAAGMLLHEGAHALTLQAMRDRPELQNAFDHMRKELIRFLDSTGQKDKKKKLEYYLDNHDEFLAGGYDNQLFRETLATTPVSKSFTDRFGPLLGDGPHTMWDAFKQKLNDIFYFLLGKRLDGTMLDAFLKLQEQFEKPTEGMAEGGIAGAPMPEGDIPQYLRDAFKTGSALKMNNTRLKAYLEAVAEQHAREVKFSKDQEILKAGQKATSAWKENLPRVTEESRKYLLKRPDISADRFFREGELPNGSKEPRVKLHRDSVPEEMRSRIPEEFMDPDRGVHPDQVAERLGHGTGGEMLEHLARLKAQRDLEGLTPATHLSQMVDAEAQRRMERDHGRSAEEILEDAKENVFSPDTNDILHHELAALYEQLGQKPITKDALKTHAKMLFDRLPHTMHDSDGYMAEMQRQKETIPDFLLEDKPREALKAQEKAALLAYHVQFALKGEKLRAQFDRAVKNKWIRREPPGIEPEGAIPIHDILLKLGIQPKRIEGDLERQKELSKYTNLRDYVNKVNKTSEQNPDTMFPGQFPVAEFLQDEGWSKPLDELTPPEFQAVFDSLKAIDAQSRSAKKIRVKGELQELNEVRDGLIERGKAALGGKQIDAGEKQRKSFLRATGSVLLNPESWAVRLDLGNVLGPMNTLIIRPIMEGLYRERRFQREFKELWDKLPETGPVVDIPNPNLFMDPGTDFTTPMKLTTKSLRTIIQNMGNQLQREKLAKGYGIVDEQGKPQPDRIWDWLFNTIKIDKSHFDFAHVMGDIFEKAFEETEKVTTARFGVAPQRIELREVQTPWGMEKEWYHPLIPDSTRHSSKLTAEDMLEEGGFFMPSPSKGFTKERTGASYPIDLTFDMVPYKLKQILKYNAMSVPVSEVSKLVLDGKFRNFFKQYYGQEYDSALVKWLKDVSGNKEWDPSGDGTIARGMKLMQENLSNAAIAWNLGTVLKHGPTALIFSMKQVGTVNFGESALRMIREAPGAQEAWTQAMEKSGELPDRLRSMAETIRGTNEELFNQYKNKWTGKYFSIRDAIQLAGHYPVGMVDLFSAVPMWDAAYRSGIKAGMNEADAVYAADTAVRRTHGSTIIGARAGVMRARDPYGLTKTLLPFYNFMSNALQRNFEIGWRAKLAMKGRELPEMTGFEKETFEKGLKNLPNILGGALVYGPLVAIIEQLVDPIEQGEDESNIKFWGKVLTRAYPSQIPIVRDLVNALYRKADPSTGLLGTGLKVVSDELKENTWTGDDPAKTWRRTNAVVGAFTGLTNESVGKAGQYLYKSTISGEEDTPKGPVDVYEAYRHGTLNKQPRDFEGLVREIGGEPRSQR